MGKKKKEPIPLVIPINGNGTAKAESKTEDKLVQTLLTEAPVLQVDPEELRKDAEALAHECGFSGALRVDGPEIEKFPRTGYGLVFMVRELTGKQRMATAKYTKEGRRAFWMMDGVITG